MIYRFTVSAKLVAKDEFDEVTISSSDVDVDKYPAKAAVVRGVGFSQICNQLTIVGFNNSKLNQVCCIDIELDSAVWEIF